MITEQDVEDGEKLALKIAEEFTTRGLQLKER